MPLDFAGAACMDAAWLLTIGSFWSGSDAVPPLHPEKQVCFGQRGYHLNTKPSLINIHNRRMLTIREKLKNNPAQTKL